MFIGNFDDNEELAMSIIYLLKNNIKVALITAAGYGLDNKKYEIRLGGLLVKFVSSKLSREEVGRFYVFGGECNYLFQCVYEDSSDNGNKNAQTVSNSTKCVLQPILPEKWQAPELSGIGSIKIC